MNGAHFRTDDLDATFEKMRAGGAEIVQEPTEQSWARGTLPCVTRPAIWSASTSRPPRDRDAAVGSARTGRSPRCAARRSPPHCAACGVRTLRRRETATGPPWCRPMGTVERSLAVTSSIWLGAS